MLTRSSVLGKRGHQVSASPAPSVQACEQLQTPDSTPNPKRARTTTSIEDGDGNKENIPPFKYAALNATPSPRSARALRRTVTQSAITTSTRSRPAPRRTASASSLLPATPSAENSQLAISTPPPTPPTILLPLHARIRSLLRSTSNSTQSNMAGREAERASILEFLTSFIEGTSMTEDKDASSMFISGSPGTGKTALVNAIIRQLSTLNDADVKVVSINCMALKDVDALWERMIEDLSAGPKRKAAGKKLKGRELVQSLLNGFKVKYILILDELDHIASSSQSLSSIFTLTESLPAVLRLIGIANTHTLTSSSNAFVPSSNIRTIHFAPYTPTQLQAILQSRLNTLSEGDVPAQTAADVKKFLPAPALMLLTKKVAALTGDVRSLFEVLRGAIELAVALKEPSGENPLAPTQTLTTVTPQHILAALKAYSPSAPARAAASTSSSMLTTNTSSSETVTKIHNLGLQARLVLLAILLASKRLEAGLSLSASTSSSPKKLSASPVKRSSSLPNTPISRPGVGIETGALHSYYSSLLSRTEMGLFEPVSRSEFGDLMGVLEGNGIVSLSSSLLACTSPSGKSKRPFGRSASFGAGLGKSGAGPVGEVRLVEGMWGDEVLRGLGVTGSDLSSVDPREEEVRGIWQREQMRLVRDIKAAATASHSNTDILAGAFQD